MSVLWKSPFGDDAVRSIPLKFRPRHHYCYISKLAGEKRCHIPFDPLFLQRPPGPGTGSIKDTCYAYT